MVSVVTLTMAPLDRWESSLREETAISLRPQPKAGNESVSEVPDL